MNGMDDLVRSIGYGWYILEEELSSTKYYFYLVVNESGVYGTLDESGEDIVDGYLTGESPGKDAETAAKNKYAG